MNSTYWLLPLLGGLMIGASATFFLWLNGRIAGISNILGGLWFHGLKAAPWRWSFFLGLLAGGVTLLLFRPESFGQSPSSMAKLAIAGILVGVGASVSNGCTSGHGVCGLSRRSPRSLAATVIFMATAMATVYLNGRGIKP